MHRPVGDKDYNLLDTMKDPTTITAEEDEEQLIMRRLRNSVDELQRGFRWLGYSMQRVKTKADKSRYQREVIELMEEQVSTRGKPVQFQASNPKEEVVRYRRNQQTGDGRPVYKVRRKLWRSTSNSC